MQAEPYRDCPLMPYCSKSLSRQILIDGQKLSISEGADWNVSGVVYQRPVTYWNGEINYLKHDMYKLLLTVAKR